jgi:WD40 repeat protein
MAKRTAEPTDEETAAVGGESGFIAIGVSWDRKILLFDAVTFKRYAVLHTDGMSACICVSENNSRLASTLGQPGRRGYFICVWDMSVRRPIMKIGKTSNPFSNRIDLNKEGTRVIAQEHLSIVIMDTLTGERLLVVEACDPQELSSITSFCFTLDSCAFICGFANKRSSEKHDVTTGKKITEFRSIDTISRILCSPDGTMCFTVDGAVFSAYDIVSGQLFWSHSMSAIRDVCFKADGSEIFVARSGRVIESLDIVTGHRRAQFMWRTEVKKMDFNPVLNCLMILDDDHILCLEPKSGEVFNRFKLEVGMDDGSFICSAVSAMILL